MTPHDWDARQLAHDLGEIADGLAKDKADWEDRHPHKSGPESDWLLANDPEYVEWANRILASAGAGPVAGWPSLLELLEWAEGEGHDGWPTELCEPPPVIVECGCGESYTRAHWQSLRWQSVWLYDGTMPSLSMRDCPCGSTISIPCTRTVPTFRPPAEWTDEQRAAKGAEVENA